jgi:hypothetical protein
VKSGRERESGKRAYGAKRRKLICFIATSLDGFIAGPRGEIDWLDSRKRA